MLWRGTGPWSIYHRLPIHRLFPCNSFTPRPPLLLFWSARCESASASASAYLRQNAPVPEPGHQWLENRDEEKLFELQVTREQQSTGQHAITRKATVDALEVPSGLLRWLEEHFGSEPAREHILTICLPPIENQSWFQFLNNADSVCRAAEVLAQSNLPNDALYILHAAHSIGLRLKQNMYERIAYHLAMSRRWFHVLSVSVAAQHATRKTTARLLNWRARAYVEVQYFKELDRIIEQFEAHGLQPQRRTFMIILRGHLRNHDLSRATTTVQDMEKAGFPVTASTYAAIIPVYRGFGLDDFVRDRGLDILNNSQVVRHRRRALNGLLRLHLDKDDLEGALKLLEVYGSQTNKYGTENIATESGFDEQTVDLTNVPSRYATLEDRRTYTMLIDYLAKQYGHTKTLNIVLKRMKVSGIGPDVRVGACLIRMFYAHGKEHKALVVLRDCCKNRNLSVSTLKLLGFDPRYPGPSLFAPYIGEPTIELFNSVLHGAIQIRGLGATLLVLQLMKEAYIKPNHKTLETVLRHLAKEREILTRDVAEVMHSLLSFQVQPTVKVLNVILDIIVRTAKREKFKEGWNALATYVRQSMQQLNKPNLDDVERREEMVLDLSFDPELCVTDLQSTVLCNVLQPIIQSLHLHRIMADRATFALRMRHDIFTLPPDRAPEAVAQNLQIMRDRGLHPNIYHYSALMEAHCVAGNLRAAHQVLQDATASKLVPRHVILYTILISGYARRGRPDMALNVFRDMINEGVTPDISSVDAVVASFFATKAFARARRTLIDLWTMVAPFPTDMRVAPMRELMVHLRDIRDRSKPPRSDVPRPDTYKREELLALMQKVVGEWKNVMQVGDRGNTHNANSDQR
ncbi:uncharacterized protein FOMMEDRAFT_121229 [Fomitiporia mediterranea MF3/22]|uniref:uncharacterized protein n=1 Tax=Fomitiporia mediterranea (strain MF3/22) TaxID=694068 RepID=UPI0004408424|nr:uncharacterized protein FOMMEDRAFT_121229 [Fomitiporia mediterranea MF3/22]EJD03894.1 hypothetical protein FOMMEDRAFT_121229 [Fomitiporia mediterranea MF3/22]